MDKFEKQLSEQLKREKQLPVTIQERFEETYTIIRKEKKKKKLWSKPLIITVVALVILTVTWRSPIGKAIQNFIQFGQFQSETINNSGFVKEQFDSVADAGVSIQVEGAYSDRYQIGIKLSLVLEKQHKLLEDPQDISLELRLRNGQNYLSEIIPDTKPLKGKGNNLSYSSHFQVNQEEHKVDYILLFSDEQGQISELKNPILEIESINFLTNNKLKKIEGSWKLQLELSDLEAFAPIQYRAETKGEVVIEQAVATPTGFSIVYLYPKNGSVAEQYSEGIRTILRDKNGQIYETDGYALKEKNESIYCTITFPYTGYDQRNELFLSFDDKNLSDLLLVPEKY